MNLATKCALSSVTRSPIDKVEDRPSGANNSKTIKSSKTSSKQKEYKADNIWALVTALSRVIATAKI